MASTNTFAPPLTSLQTSARLPVLSKGSTVTVIGAGAFGGWTALYLLRSGMKVTMVDAWGPGNSRSSSGDETRVIRSTYGNNGFYFDMNVRALSLWKEHEKEFDQQLFINTGVLWLCYDEKTPLVDESIPFARKHKMEYEYLPGFELKKRYPLINTSDLHHAYFDSHGGVLKARESCQAVAEAFISGGGEYIQDYALPGKIQSGRMKSLNLLSGREIDADAFLFACGSWLGKLFPEVLDKVITCTKQEVYYFGVPAGKAQDYNHLPVWVDVDGENFYYGIPGNSGRGFKIGVDQRGELFDPSNGEHALNPEVLLKARKFIGHRFPGLKDAPLAENRVCPYENSPDGNFVFTSHPDAENVLFLGGGSGHGFKHGPALGEWVSKALCG